MRQGIFTLGLIAAVSLPGCTGGKASSNAVTPTPAATPTAIAMTASDPSFPGEAQLCVDEGQSMAQLLRQAASKNIYLNDVNRLLAKFGSVEANSCVPVQPLIEPLSDRELEVLQNIATGMSNQAICADARRLANAPLSQTNFSLALQGEMARSQYFQAFPNSADKLFELSTDESLKIANPGK